MPNPYLANNVAVATRPLPGTEKWAQLANRYSNGALWNNGTWVVRDVRGKPGQISNHARGIAMDLSYRYSVATKKGVPDGRKKSLEFMRTCLSNYDALGIMLVIDYWPQPYGRSWRCDRAGVGVVQPAHGEAWQKPAKHMFTGAPGGDWWHVEITPTMAHNADKVTEAFKTVFKVSTTTV
jgi:hypothetical protein